jgi:hypothetical protein
VIALLDNGQDLEQCAGELGCEVGQLLTPLTRYRLRDPDRPWAIENGFFSPEASISAWLSLLEREKHHANKCLFVTLPDVIGSARRTLEVYEYWRRREELRIWKRALVCQDGQEHLPIPWEDLSAVFLGGSTNWKCGPHAVQIIKAAQALGKWVHAGRVNHGERWEHFEKLGVDSADGTGISRYTHMREKIAQRYCQPTMDLT